MGANSVMRAAQPGEVPFTIYRFHENGVVGGRATAGSVLEHITTVWPRIGEGDISDADTVVRAVEERAGEFPAGKYVAFRADGRVDLNVVASIEVT